MKNKIIIFVFVILFLGFINESYCSYTPEVDNTLKIYDFMNVLSEEQKQSIYKDISSYINEYSMDMVIVISNDNEKNSSMEYADDFFDYNDFGIGEDKSGILFFMDMKKRNLWISTTGKAINIYTDSKIDSILDDTFGYIKNYNYYMCAKSFISRAAKYANSANKISNYNDTAIHVDNTIKIYDYKNVLTDTQKNSLYNDIVSFIKEYNTDMAIIILDENNKFISKANANIFYNTNNFGVGEDKSGILFFISDKNSWISAYGKALTVFKYSKINMLDDIDIENEGYYESAKTFISNARNCMENIKKIELMSITFCMLIVSSIITIVIILERLQTHKSVKIPKDANQYTSTVIQLSDEYDNFEKEYTFESAKKTDNDRYYSKSDSSSRSYGSSSTHTSSSGSTHGGGGRSF